MRFRLEHLLIILMLCAGAAAAALGFFAFRFAHYEQEHRAREKLSLLSGEGAALAAQLDRYLTATRDGLLAKASAAAPRGAAVRDVVAGEPLFYRGFVYDLGTHRLVYPPNGFSNGFDDLFSAMIGSGTDENPVTLGMAPPAAPPAPRAMEFGLRADEAAADSSAAAETPETAARQKTLHFDNAATCDDGREEMAKSAMVAEALEAAAGQKALSSEKAVTRGAGRNEMAESVADERLRRLVPRFEGFVRRGRTGVIPWYAGDRWAPLVWAADADRRFVCGFEVNATMLLSRLVALLPPALPEGFRLEFVGGSGKVLCAAGGEPGKGVSPQVAGVFPLSGGLLENYQVRALLLPSGTPEVLRPAIWALLAVLCATIMVAGGGAFYLSRRELRLSRLRSGFVSQVSHELKTPLTGIRLHSELLNNPALPESKRSRSLHAIAAECERLSRLVDNVLDFSRIERRSKRYSPQRVELSAFLRDFCESAAAGMPLDLELELPVSPVYAVVDPDSLIQVLRNLVDNAAKYAAAGRRLKIELLPGAVRVRDFGPGVSAADRERIFRRFYRVDDRLTAVSGSGLGLSIARRLMRDQGGDLRCVPCESGACFEIAMPPEDEHA
ncbi:MAG: sensor histidine kinase [Victivallaceae bacterium]